MIIGLNGYAQSGKDEAARALVEQGFERRAFADILRRVAYATDPYVVWKGDVERISAVVDDVGWDTAKTESMDIRRLLQRLGTEGGRAILGENVWVEATLGDAGDEDIVVTDVRFSNEADYIKKCGGVVVNITRPGVGPVNGHISDNAMENYPFDEYLRNDGSVEDLHAMILEVVEDARD